MSEARPPSSIAMELAAQSSQARKPGLLLVISAMSITLGVLGLGSSCCGIVGQGIVMFMFNESGPFMQTMEAEIQRIEAEEAARQASENIESGDEEIAAEEIAEEEDAAAQEDEGELPAGKEDQGAQETPEDEEWDDTNDKEWDDVDAWDEDDESAEPVREMLDMQQKMFSVQRKFMIPITSLLVINLVIATALLVGGIGCLSLSPSGRITLMIACIAGVIFAVMRGAVNLVMMFETQRLMSDMMPADQQMMMDDITQFSQTISIVFQLGWMLALIIFYLLAFVYLRSASVYRLFHPWTDAKSASLR